MLVKILELTKIFFSQTSMSENYKMEFVIGLNRINIIRGKITTITFIILEAFLLTIYFITNRDSLFEKPDIYYGSMYTIMLLAMIIFLLLFIKLGNNVPEHGVGIRYAGVFFIGFILIWCAGISLLDQLSNGQVIVYVVAIISIAVVPIYEPVPLFLIYLTIHAFFLILMPNFQKSAEMLFGNYINTTAFLILSWAISYMRHRKQVEDFIINKIIQDKNEELKRINKELEDANQKLEVLSKTDGLTGIFNRLMFEIKIKDEWSRCKRHSIPLSIVMVDVDFFKEFNDQYGHKAGDYCLKQVAEVLSVCVKRSSDIVARYGGEEFVIVLPHSKKKDAIELAEQMRKRVEEMALPHLRSNVSDYLTISLGVNTIIPSDESSIEEFIRNADQALYKAKERRNCLAVYGQAEGKPTRVFLGVTNVKG